MELIGYKIAALTFLRALYAVVYWDPKEQESEFNDAQEVFIIKFLGSSFLFLVKT